MFNVTEITYKELSKQRLKRHILVFSIPKKQRTICYYSHTEDEESKKQKLIRIWEIQAFLVLNIKDTSWEYSPALLAIVHLST